MDCFRLKTDRWIKLLAVEEYHKIILDFLDNAEPPLIIFTQSGPGILAVSNTPLNTSQHPAIITTSGGGSSATRMKSLYFLKKRPQPVDREEPRRSLIFGDLAPHPLEQVLTFLDEVQQFCFDCMFMLILCPFLSDRWWHRYWTTQPKEGNWDKIPKLHGHQRFVLNWKDSHDASEELSIAHEVFWMGKLFYTGPGRDHPSKFIN